MLGEHVVELHSRMCSEFDSQGWPAVEPMIGVVESLMGGRTAPIRGYDLASTA